MEEARPATNRDLGILSSLCVCGGEGVVGALSVAIHRDGHDEICTTTPLLIHLYTSDAIAILSIIN